MYALDCRNCVQVVDSRIELRRSERCSQEKTPKSATHSDLVHDGDSSVLCLLFELQHSGRDVARGNDILLVADGRLDDGGVVGVGNQADHDGYLGDFGIESGFIVDIKLNGQRGIGVGEVRMYADGSSILDTVG